jgi:type IV pilus assembly protein PilV
MLRPTPSSLPEEQGGLAILEALIAVLLFSLGLLGMAGFQAASIKAQDEAKKRADAAFVANQIVGDMWSIPKEQLSTCAGTFTKGTTGCGNAPWGDRIDQTLPGGQAEVVVNATQVTVTLTWTTPGVTEEHRYVHLANVSRN